MNNLLAPFTKLFAHHSDGPHPGRDWLLIISIVAVLLLVSIGWSFWFFAQVAREVEDPGSASSAATLPHYPTAQVEAIFTARSDTRDAYEHQYPFIDPSR
jgi:hypothetical protein